MVDYIIEICKDMGLETVYGIMLPENHTAIDIMIKMGFTIKHQEDGTVKGTINLQKE
jgi:hypothetical protein